jgi:hypothetical protein
MVRVVVERQRCRAVRWAAVIVVSVVVAGFAAVGYHRTLPPCFRAGAQWWRPYAQGTSPYAPSRRSRIRSCISGSATGFFSCR